jgi:hypothetical protein
MNRWIRRDSAMNSLKIIIVAAALATLSGYAHAENLKPLQGVSFHALSIDAVAYFLSENRSCKVVLTMADADQPTRFEASISAGESTSYKITEGKSLEFGCQADAQALTINMTATIAAN